MDLPVLMNPQSLSSQAATTNRILVTFHGNIISNKLLKPEINQRQIIIEFEIDKLGYLKKIAEPASNRICDCRLLDRISKQINTVLRKL